ncbi:MAG: MBL fold metallo-hydrolase [Thermoanaerobaculia bacterium]
MALGELAIEGRSSAGEETWFRVHPPGLAFDAGRGAGDLAGVADLFLTHGHLDHALGVPYLVSQRRLHHGSPLRVFCPRAIVADLAAFVAAAARLERVEYALALAGLAPGERVAVGRDLAIEAFAVDHVVPALGYHLLRRRRHLLPELVGTPSDEIARLRSSGVEVAREREEVWLSYCGDTGAGVFDLAPRLAASRVLMIELTFLAPEARAKGAAYGHLHLDDLVERAGALAAHETVVLYHLSRRHSPAELRREVERRLPQLASRVRILHES